MLHAHDWLVQSNVAGRAEKAGVTESENATIASGQPIAGAGDRARHTHHWLVEADIAGRAVKTGITESENTNGEEYGKDRFARRILEGIDLPAKELIEFIRQGLDEFTGQKSLSDDATLFIVKAI